MKKLLLLIVVSLCFLGCEQGTFIDNRLYTYRELQQLSRMSFKAGWMSCENSFIQHRLDTQTKENIGNQFKIDSLNFEKIIK
jgi:hypothetical protein